MDNHPNVTASGSMDHPAAAARNFPHPCNQRESPAAPAQPGNLRAVRLDRTARMPGQAGAGPVSGWHLTQHGLTHALLVIVQLLAVRPADLAASGLTGGPAGRLE